MYASRRRDIDISVKEYFSINSTDGGEESDNTGFLFKNLWYIKLRMTG